MLMTQPIPETLSRLTRVVLLGLVFWVAPVGFQIDFADGWLSFSPGMAMAKDGEDDSDDSDDDNDDDDDDDDDDNSGSGSDDTDDDDSSGGDDDEDDDDNSGSSGGNGDDDNGDDDDATAPRPGTTTAPQAPATASSNGQVWTVLWVRVSGRDIEVRYTDGWTEIIRGDRYLLIDDRNRVAMDRRLRDADRARLAPLFP